MPSQPRPDLEALKGLSGTASPGVNEDSGFWDIDFNLGETLNTASLGMIPSTTGEPPAQAAPITPESAERRTAAGTQASARILQLLEDANIDINNPITQSWLVAIAGGATGAEATRQQLTYLAGPEGDLFIQAFVQGIGKDALLVTQTPYSQELAANAFTSDYGALFTSTEQAMTGAREGGSLAPTGAPGYEVSDQTGAIRYANGTIVTEGGGIIFDPSKSAPGSSAYLRDAANWDEVKIQEWKGKLVALGYLSKEDAKVPGFTTQFRDQLQKYWFAYYNNGGRPISAETSATGSGGTLPEPVDYSEFVAEASNNMRGQLARVLGVEPTEAQVRAQVQYVIRTATELQTKFRQKGNRGNLGTQYNQATEQAISNIETSPYAQDVRENTGLRDAMQNAATVTRSLMS